MHYFIIGNTSHPKSNLGPHRSLYVQLFRGLTGWNSDDQRASMAASIGLIFSAGFPI